MTNSTWNFYDEATGLFSGAGFSGAIDTLVDQLAHKGPGIGAHEGTVDYLAQKLDLNTGLLIAYTPPGPTLAALKANRWESIKAARATALDAPLVTPKGTFDADGPARANIGGAVALAQTATAAGHAFAITYTLHDNTAVTLDAADMVSVGLSLGAKVQAAFATARALRAQIDAAITPEAIALISWPAQ